MKARTALAIQIFALAWLLILFSPEIAAQTVPREDAAESQDPIEQPPPGVSFTLRLKDGKTKFTQGELITIEMLFASSVPNTYKVDSRTYDRSGRLGADTYHVDPEIGSDDPLREYVQSAFFGSSMGGLAAIPPPLSEKPYVIAQDLNEYVRFDRPGKYRLKVTNSRIAKLDPNNPHRSGARFTVTSNPIEIEIVAAEPRWQEQKIQEAKAIVEGATPGDRRSACRVLRFLNSEAAEAEMIRQYRGNTDGCDGDFHFGLLSSPRRDFVIGEMEMQITAPEYPVTSSFLYTLITLNYLARYPPPSPYPAGDEQKLKEYQSEMQKRRAGFQEITSQYTQQLYLAVARKEKSALPISLATVLEFESGLPKGKRSLVSSALPGLFVDLPYYKQYSFLSSRWKSIAGPAMLPALRQVLERPWSKEEGTFSDLRGLAVQRLFELAPDEGRATILKEIQRTPLRISPQALSILPVETFPEFDEILSERLARRGSETELHTIAHYSPLVARYATSASLPAVKRATANRMGTMGCEVQSNTIAFFLRVEPDFGAEVLEQALAARKERGCYKWVFDAVARLHSSTKFDRVAAAHLDDPELDVAVQAASVLGQSGSVAAEQPLIDRLERWHTQWNGREKEIQPQIENGIVAGEPAQFERELVRALIYARAWVTDAEKLNRIRKLCLTPSGRSEVDAALRDSREHSIQIILSSIDDSVETTAVDQYRPETVDSLKEKLTQFPKGSRFLWRPTNAGALAEEQLFNELKAFLKQHDMKLEKPDK